MSLFVNVQVGDKLVRCLDIDNVKWYCCKDIAMSLGYKHTTHTIRTHIDDKFMKNNGTVIPECQIHVKL